MNKLLLPFLKAYGATAKEILTRKARDPIATQERFLLELLQAHQKTDLGQQFGLEDIRTVAAFRDRVPIWSYDDYEPYIERIVQGEPNVLNPDPVIYINLTSGTTGKQKMVPVTRRFKKVLARANAASFGFSLTAFRRHSRSDRPLEFGKLMAANSVRLQGRTAAGIEYGPVTAGSYRMNRRLCELAFAQPYQAMEAKDVLTRHYVCLLFALCNPQTRGLSANFPMLVLQICRYLEEYAESFIEDIARGTIASWLSLEPEIREYLEKRWQPDPKRAAELRHILKTEGRLTPRSAWSKLSFVATARGGTSDFYFDRFPDYFGDLPISGGVYGTAEGTFAVYTDFNTDGAVLALDSGFYEFIPRDQWDATEPKTLLSAELKVGEFYRILVTSYSGVYRYDIGDVVEVVGFYENTPMIVFRHRRGGLLSSTTEKTTEFHVIQTMQMLQQEFGINLDDFCVTLSAHEFPAHYWVNIELAEGQTLSKPEAFLARFDYWLGEFNNPYTTVRSADVPPPRLRILAPGSFEIVRQRQLKRGTSESQLKIPHVSEDRNFLSGLEVMEEVRMVEQVSALEH
ncbi:MAG TPA: GH3 auxin-responsive promoter family protein [Trichocoleus sp.]|jgi:acyl-CoA synthetase (AMP-forming)/AMP-acid ligase II